MAAPTVTTDSPNTRGTSTATVRGVLVDVDGTLIDSNDAHVRAWLEAMARNGYPDVPYGKVRALIGMGSDHLLPHAIGVEKESEPGERMVNDWREIYNTRYLPHLQPFPGARELLHRLRAAGVKLVIASSAEREMVDRVLQIVGADDPDLIDGRTTGSDAERSKPDPDRIVAGLERLGLPADEAVLLGDTPYDIEAAARAGVGTVALRCGGFPDDALAGALALYDDPADLLARFDGSPFVRHAAAGGGGGR